MAAGSGSEWRVVEFERVRGDFPIRTYLSNLDERHAKDAAAILAKLGVLGNQMRPPDSKIVKGKLYEARRFQVRIFFMFRPGREIVLLDGIIKKQDQIPPRDVERMLGYVAEVDRRGPRAP